MIALATKKDINIVIDMAMKLFKESNKEKLNEEFEKLFNDEGFVVFLKFINERVVGFAQCQLRNDYVEGCDYSPVCYLEGIYIEEKYRKKGYAKQLLEYCCAWGKKHNCKEFASDCEITNEESYLFHLKCGFLEMNKIICFKKSL